MHSADPIRLDAKPALTGASWAGAAARSGLARVGHDATPVGDASGESSSGAAADGAQRRWLGPGLRFLRHAAIGLSLIFAVPLSVVAVRGDVLFRAVERSEDVNARLDDIAPMRAMTLPKDATITPLTAGELLHGLHPSKPQSGYPTRSVAQAPDRVWQQLALNEQMFAGLRTTGAQGEMAKGIVTAAVRGFSPAEMTYLRAIAEAPVWRDVERVGSAPAVDMLGGRYLLPFPPSAWAFELPILSFRDMKELAYAGVSRAAYFVATGQPDHAEHALKTIVSYGYVLIDNGSRSMDALIGRVIVGIARDGLNQLYTVTGNREGMALTAPPARSDALPHGTDQRPIDKSAVHARILAGLRDPTLPRSLRFEQLRSLDYSSCGSVRGLLFGPTAEVRGAFAEAKRSLARFPSERAYIDLILGATSRLPPGFLLGTIADRTIMGAATVTSAVLGNPRMAACTRIVLAHE